VLLQGASQDLLQTSFLIMIQQLTGLPAMTDFRPALFYPKATMPMCDAELCFGCVLVVFWLRWLWMHAQATV
jgi:hypothetical protein